MIWIPMFICLWFLRRKTHNTYVTQYFYKSDAQFAQEQLEKYHPELLYQLAAKQYEAGEISKKDYDKAVESLIKDITII